MLAGAAVQPILQLQWQVFPYIVTGLLVVLIFWSRALVHTLSFIGWPLEFGHTFAYFGATLIEAVALTQVAEPAHWFALNALYALAVWGLYAWDLRVVLRDARAGKRRGTRASGRHPPRPAAQHPLHDAGRGRVPGIVVVAGAALPAGDARTRRALAADRPDPGLQRALPARRVRLLRRRQHWLLLRAAN